MMKRLRTTFAVVSLAFLLIVPGVVQGQGFEEIGHVTGIAGKQSAALAAAKPVPGKKKKASIKRAGAKKKAKKCALKGKKKAVKQTKKKPAKGKKCSLKASKKKAKKGKKLTKRTKSVAKNKKKGGRQSRPSSRKLSSEERVSSQAMFAQLSRRVPGLAGAMGFSHLSAWMQHLPGAENKEEEALWGWAGEYVERIAQGAHLSGNTELTSCLELLKCLLRIQAEAVPALEKLGEDALDNWSKACTAGNCSATSPVSKVLIEVGDSTLTRLIGWLETRPGAPVKVKGDLSRLATLTDWGIRYVEAMKNRVIPSLDYSGPYACVDGLQRFLIFIKDLTEREQQQLGSANIPAATAI